MAEQIGVVIDSEPNGWARVITDRRDACGGCDTKPDTCKSCLTSAKLESRVSNPLNAQAGDIVKISLPTADLFKGAAVLYLLPVAAVMAGAFAGLWAGGLLGLSGGTGPIIGGLLALVGGFWLVVKIGRSRELGRQMTPAITSVVSKSGRSADPTTASCCSS